MNQKIKFAIRIAWNFFIVLSIITFLTETFSLIQDNITDTLVSIFASCGFCFLVIIVVKWRFDDIFTEYYSKKEITENEPKSS